MSSIRITVGFHSEPSAPLGFPGVDAGLRIEADTLVLTGPANPEQYDDEYTFYDVAGNELERDSNEFVGEWLSLYIDDLQEAIEPFLAGSADRHTEYVAKVRGEMTSRLILFSHLDGDSVRVAAKAPRDEDSEYVPLEAMIGTAVSPEDVGRELIECRRTMLERTEIAFDDAGPAFDEDKESFRTNQQEQIAALEQYLDS